MHTRGGILLQRAFGTTLAIEIGRSLLPRETGPYLWLSWIILMAVMVILAIKPPVRVRV